MITLWKMHLFLPLLLLVTSVLSSQVAFKVPDSQFENHNNEPGFNLDLNALRLVQLVDADKSEWMTERQKFKLKAAGFGFLDMQVHSNASQLS